MAKGTTTKKGQKPPVKPVAPAAPAPEVAIPPVVETPVVTKEPEPIAPAPQKPVSCTVVNLTGQKQVIYINKTEQEKLTPNGTLIVEMAKHDYLQIPQIAALIKNNVIKVK